MRRLWWRARSAQVQWSLTCQRTFKCCHVPVYVGKDDVQRDSYHVPSHGEMSLIEEAMDRLAKAQRPIIYAGGGVVNSGPRASELLRELAALSGVPVTNTLMGLGSFPASDPQFVGMLGMHGTYEANMAMHDCDFMLNIGARFDDRITGRVDAFSPGSFKVHVDIDPSSINKNVRAIYRSLGIARQCWKTWSMFGVKRTIALKLLTCGHGGARSTRGAALTVSSIASPRVALFDPNTLCNAFGSLPNIAMMFTSQPKLASIKCGPRSIIGLNNRTTG